MIDHLYGNFSNMQLNDAVVYIRKKIFYLLLLVDRRTNEQYKGVSVEDAFTDVFYIINGLNTILREPKEVVVAISLLQSALNEYTDPHFHYSAYRKLVLDAGHEIGKLREVRSYAGS